jgi:hypothetical protein
MASKAPSSQEPDLLEFKPDVLHQHEEVLADSTGKGRNAVATGNGDMYSIVVHPDPEGGCPRRSF